MKLVNSQNRIIELMSRFVAQIEDGASMGKTDLNKTAETILIPLLDEVYGWSLKNINYAEDNNNYPGIDLADEGAGISIQVTATPTLDKVKHTLEQFAKHNQYLKYNRLIIYILKKKQDSYSQTTIQKIIQNRFNFDPQKDIWDRHNIIKEVSNFQIYKALRVQEILEANFGEDKSPSASLIRELEQKTDWQQICRGMLPIELDTNPLIAGDGVKLGIGDIVPLDLVERKEQPKPTRDPLPEDSRQALEDQEIPLPYNQFFSHVLTGCRSFNQQGKGVAIIGEPGAGKTTLLCAIADWIIKRGDLPIFVSLQDLETVPLETCILEVWLKDALRKREAPKQLQDDLVEQCNAGRVWLLLDGVDEMAQSDKFLSVFAREFRGWIADVRVVLTCRVNVWEANRNDLRSKFEVYRSRGFNNEDQLIFIQNFFAKANEPDTGNKLIQELENAPLRLKDLTKTPLWLTLLCRVWKRRRGSLPTTKAELYRQFTETFYDWKDKLHVPEKKRPLLERALGELAKKAIDQEQFRFRLRETFIRQELDKFDFSLFNIACELGWINKLGSVEDPYESVYAFLHPTFQEYFAALAIEDWHYFLNYIPENLSLVNADYRILDTRWKEIACFWVEQNSDLSNQLIKDLYRFSSNNDSSFFDYYHYLSKALAAILVIHSPLKTTEYAIVLDEILEIISKNPSRIPASVRTSFFKEYSEVLSEFIRLRVSKLYSTYKEPEEILDPVILLISLQPYEENFDLLERVETRILDNSPEHEAWVTDRVGAVYAEYRSAHPRGVLYKSQVSMLLKNMNLFQIYSSASEMVSKNLENEKQNLESYTKDDLVSILNENSKSGSVRFIVAFDEFVKAILNNEIEVKFISFLLHLILIEVESWNAFHLMESGFLKIIRNNPSIVVTLLRRYVNEQGEFIEQTISKNFYERLLFCCAQNMTYPDFYRAWYSSSSISAELPRDDNERNPV